MVVCEIERTEPADICELDKSQKKETEPCFVEVFRQIPSPIMPSVQPAAEILIEKGDVKIHIPINLGRGELRAVLEGLGGAL